MEIGPWRSCELQRKPHLHAVFLDGAYAVGLDGNLESRPLPRLCAVHAATGSRSAPPKAVPPALLFVTINPSEDREC